MPTGYSIIVAFVDPNDMGRIRTYLKQEQITGVTALCGRGTVRNPLLQLIGLDNPRRELLIFVTENSKRDAIMTRLAEVLHMEKAGKGFCLTLPASRVYGMRTQNDAGYAIPIHCMKTEEDISSYELIVSIINQGRAKEVIAAAQKGGSQGATILHGRGSSGARKVEKLFDFDIKPEKEVVLIVSECHKTDEVVDAIRSEIDFNKPNTGILFTFGVSDVRGLIQNIG